MEIKIKIKVKDVELEVSKEDLKELYDFLKGLFEERTVDHWIPYPTYPTYPRNPWITYTDTAGNEWKEQWRNGDITVYYSTGESNVRY